MTAIHDQPASKALRSDSGLARLWNRDALLAAAIVAVLPNLLFLLIAPWMLIRRMAGPVLFLAAGLLSFFVPWPVSLILFLLASAVDAFLIVSLVFDMPFDTTLQAIQFAGDIKLSASLLYVAAIAYFVAMPIGLCWLVHKYRRDLRRASPVLATLVAAAVTYADFSLNGFKPISLPPFESAMAQNGLTADAIVTRDRNLLIVLVEGMGAYAHPAEREILAGRLRQAAEGRFRFASGTSNYYGSTTGAESRELCGKWATYVDYVAVKDADCLPDALAKAGYRTVSYHAGGPELFLRRNWYPKIGIGEMNFRDELLARLPADRRKPCGSVFLGACDGNVGDIVHADLLQAGDRRGLFYWLTLDSHLPYQPDPRNRLKCRTTEAAIKADIACELTEIWADVFDKVAAIAADPAMPPLDIVVVGDHNTPMWSRSAFGHFINRKVDWYYLEDARPVRQEPLHAAASG
jgi:hypothetical protein